MQFSVIIPVYNAEPYLRQSVESALAQPQTGEVVLVEDNSPDGSYEICQQLAAEYPDRVALFTHPNRQNLGAGETRNRAIRESRFPFVSFLDADDFMLPNRYASTVAALAEHPNADGVYEAVGIHFETEKARSQWLSTRNYETTTVAEAYPPKELFFRTNPIVETGINYIHTNGWTIRRALLDRVGLFNPALRLHQDTELFLRVTMIGNFTAGNIAQPVAVRRVHESNRITAPRTPEQSFRGYQMMWQSAFSWSVKNASARHAQALAQKVVGHRFGFENTTRFHGALRRTLRGVLSEAGSGSARIKLVRPLLRLLRAEGPARFKIWAGSLKSGKRSDTDDHEGDAA